MFRSRRRVLWNVSEGWREPHSSSHIPGGIRLQDQVVSPLQPPPSATISPTPTLFSLIPFFLFQFLIPFPRIPNSKFNSFSNFYFFFPYSHLPSFSNYLFHIQFPILFPISYSFLISYSSSKHPISPLFFPILTQFFPKRTLPFFNFSVLLYSPLNSISFSYFLSSLSHILFPLLWVLKS